MRPFLLTALGVVLAAAPARAVVQLEAVEYRQGDAVLEGTLAYDDATGSKRPAVLVVHEWKGPGQYTRERARQLAELGYIALAADIYGKGVRPATHEEAGQVSGIYRNDRALLRARVRAGLDVLVSHPLADPARVAAIGYCFGGTSVLELARSGADVKGVVSFHGGLGTSEPARPGQVKAKVLVLTGADDPHVKPEDVKALEEEMKAAGADCRVIAYPGAVHSFTVPEAGDDPSTGVAYNAEADRRSWDEMKAFFEGLFGPVSA